MITAALLCACAQVPVDLGGNGATTSVPQPSLCSDARTLVGNPVVLSAADLAALEGCEFIDGTLQIASYEGVDLRPLHALQRARGLWLNTTYSNGAGFDSLAGLEQLSEVESLEIDGLLAPDVHELARLTAPIRELTISASPALVDLSGLSNVRSIETLSVADNASLTTLRALDLGGTMRLLLRSNPALLDIGEVSDLTELSVRDSAFETLEPVAALTRVASLELTDNLLLTDLAALAQDWSLTSLTIHGNPRITEIPSLEGAALLEWRVSNNAELTRIAAPKTALDRMSIRSALQVQIHDNPNLVEASLPLEQRAASHLLIQNNPQLERLSLEDLRDAESITIVNNPRLSSVDCPNLSYAERLVLRGNPALPPETFAGVTVRQ